MDQGPIRIEVREADALDYATDVLVLKYAQTSHGVDAAAVNRAQVPRDRLPPPGEYHAVRDPLSIAASTVIFVGVVVLQDFGYRAIRGFGYRALSTVRAVVPSARKIALTLHGVGYGLDESESFYSEIAGVLDAVRDGAIPEGLEQVTVVDINAARVSRLKQRLAAAGLAEAIPARATTLTEALADRFRSVGYDSAERSHAFIAMPFSDPFSDVFQFGIYEPVRACGLLCERIDQQAFTGDILDRVKKQIRTAKLVVADLTGANPNVYLEVGLAWGAQIPTILLCRDNSDLAFDVRGERCLRYFSIQDLKDQLTKELKGLEATSTLA